jgi:hypothetical protein
MVLLHKKQWVATKSLDRNPAPNMVNALKVLLFGDRQMDE